MRVYVVRDKFGHVISAWPDVYEAKFEQGKWEEMHKVPYEVVVGELEISETPQST